MSRETIVTAAVLAAAIGLLACGAGSAAPPASRWAVIADREVALEGAVRVEPEEPQTAPLPRAAELLAEARQHAMRFEPREALTAVSEAQEILENHVRSDEARTQLHLALALRGLLESNLERPLAAREALERAARLDPEAALEDELFPPDVQAVYDELVREVRAEPPASLAITSDPARASVRFDGREIGDAPASVHARAGPHFVDVDALAYERRLLPVRLSADGNAPLVVRLPPASAGHTAWQLLSLDDDTIRGLDRVSREALAERFDADVLLRVRGDTLVGLSLIDERQLAGALDERPLSSWVDELFYSEPDGAAQVFGSGWFWLVVGVVVAGAVAGALTAILYEPPGRIRIETVGN